MSFPPGIIYLSKLLPGLLIPPVGSYLLKWFFQVYFKLSTPHWMVVPLCSLSLPVAFTAKILYHLYARCREAAVHGAVLPPTLPSSIGGIDLLLSSLRDTSSDAPGEPLAVLAKRMGHTYSMHVLFEDRFHRGMTCPFFKCNRISDFELFNCHLELAITQFKKCLHEGYPVDFQDMILCFAMDSSGEFLFGHYAKTLSAGLPYPFYAPPSMTTARSHSLSAFAAALLETQLVSAMHGLFGTSWPLLEFWKDRIKVPMAVIHKFMDPILTEAVAKKHANVGGGVVAMKAAHADRKVQEGETLVEHLLNYTEDRTILRDKILNISLVGRDTVHSLSSACLLTFVIYMLAKHSDVLGMLRAEILSTVGSSRAPTPNDFRDMKYMRAVLNETLRLYPPVSTTQLVILPSTTGGKPFYIPVNSNQTVTPNPFIFLPFNTGPRICLSQQFTYHEASFFLVRLLQQFLGISLALDVQPADSRVPEAWAQDNELGWKAGEKLRVKNHLTMYIAGGLWVNMQEAVTADVV
ncbi:cytochrome P450 [Mycena sp. CBHHK59/15]|nr:cytochrome P450 [Mycena sp. CBHHK59/15]